MNRSRLTAGVPAVRSAGNGAANGTGFVSVYPCGQPFPKISNLNFVKGIDRANLVKTKIGADGDVCFFTAVGTQLIADLEGYFTPNAA